MQKQVKFGKQIWFLAPSVVLILAGCAKPESRQKQFSNEQQVQTHVDESVGLAGSATTEEEWTSSEYNPTMIFAKVRNANSPTQNQILCDKLLSLSPKEIVVFEGEIENPENKEILQDCHVQVHNLIQDFYSEEKEKMAADGMATFAENTRTLISSGEVTPQSLKIQGTKKKLKYSVQTRDLSQGYTAFSGDVKPGQFVLTYDDGPHQTFTNMILSALDSYGGKGIFFMTGKSTESNPNVAKLVAKAGHAIGSHSYSHPYMGSIDACRGDDCRKMWVNTLKAMSEIRTAHEVIFRTIGYIDPFFRFPFGAKTPELRQFLKQNQVADFAWQVDSNDWRPGQTPREVMNNTLQAMAAAKRGIVLFHDVHQRTAEMMPQFLSSMVDLGYEVVLLKASDDELRTRPMFFRSDVVKP